MKDRIKSIDFLRGLSVILMVAGHMYYYWTEKYSNIYGYTINFIVISAAPIFPIVSGFGYYSLINNKIIKENTKSDIFKEVLIRAIFIFFISTIILFFLGFIIGAQFNSILYWSIFQLISISMGVFFVIPFLRRIIRCSLYVILFFTIFFIGHIIFYYQMENLYFLVNIGNFPFFPWANFFLFGIFLGDFMINLPKDKINKVLLIFLIIGIIIFIIFFVWFINIEYLYLNIFFKNFGIFFISFSILFYLFDVKGLEFSVQKRISLWGMLAFSLYYIHFGLIILGIFIFPLILNDIYFNGLPLYLYLIFVIISLFLLDVFLRLWQKFNYFLGIEWIMNKITQKSLFIKKES